MPKRRDAVLLCGPARRLLAAVARELTRAGVPLVIQAAPGEMAGARRLAAAARGGSPIRIVPAMLDGDDASRRLIDEAWAAGKGIGAVVLCLDTPPAAAAGDPGPEEWQGTIESRLRGPFFVAKHAGRRSGRAGGRVVVAVDAARRPVGAVAAVVRAGLECMVDALARALPDVAVSAVFGGGGGAAPQGATEIGRTVRFLVAEPALPSGTIVDLGAARRG